MLLKILSELLEEHRKQAFVTCDVHCFCWPVQGFINGQIRDAQLRNEAEAGEQKSPSCSPTQHIWKTEYYGYKCERCPAFIPYGSEPWAYIEE